MDRIALLPRRLPIVGLIALAVAITVLGLKSIPWFHGHTDRATLAVTFTSSDDPALDVVGNTVAALAAIVAMIYFSARMMAAGLLILIGGPTSTRKVAWLAPWSAHLQGALVLAVGIVAVAWKPELRDHVTRAPVETHLERGWGGFVFLAGLALAQVAIWWIAHSPLLAATQGWPVAHPIDPDPAPIKRRERPMRSSPPLPAPFGDATPFRDAGNSELAAKLVATTRAPEPAVVHADDTAPQPKLLK